jgi:hypothetical protein
MNRVMEITTPLDPAVLFHRMRGREELGPLSDYQNQRFLQNHRQSRREHQESGVLWLGGDAERMLWPSTGELIRLLVRTTLFLSTTANR